MLKTSGSTESITRPGKGGVGVGSDGGGDDGGNGNDDGGHDHEHSLRDSGQEHQWTRQLARPRLWLSLMGLMLVVILVASRSKSWSKSRQKVEESSKSPINLKGLKSCKGHRFGETFTEASILRQRTRTFDIVLTVFRALFAGPRSSPNTTFKSIIDKVKLMELLMLCHMFPFFVCKTHVISPLNFGDALRNKTS